MKNPSEVLTETGWRKFQNQVYNIDEGLFFILNHADDLEIEETDLDTLYATQKLMETYGKFKTT